MPFLSWGEQGGNAPQQNEDPAGAHDQIVGRAKLALQFGLVCYTIWTMAARYANFLLPLLCSPEADLISGDTFRKEYGSAKNAWTP
jgi:hypothetical protein